MNFNDKFLNVCFKLGKIVFSVLLVIALIVCTCLLFTSASSAIKTAGMKIEYKYNAQETLNGILQRDGVKISASTSKDSKKDKTDDEFKKLEKKIDLFAKDNNLKNGTTTEIKRAVKLIDEKDREAYFNNFIKFHKDFTAAIVNYNVNENKDTKEHAESFVKSNIDDITFQTYNEYLALYNIEKSAFDSNYETSVLKRNVNFIAFLISLGIFILFLFLPILIRIEENTRK